MDRATTEDKEENEGQGQETLRNNPNRENI